MKIAVLDDSQHVAQVSADWSGLDVTFFHEGVETQALQEFDILVPMRERMAFDAATLAKLPRLKMIALTGARAATLDLVACKAQGIVVSNTGGDYVINATPELAWGLLLSCARGIAQADASMRQGGWHEGLPFGTILHGKTLGVLGLGKLGKRVAAFGKAFGMKVQAWSQNLTPEACAEQGVAYVSKETLFATSDVLSLHLVMSARTKGIVGAQELAQLKTGTIVINTARAGLIDETALLAELTTGRLHAGLDVFSQEPLPAKHPLHLLKNVTLTPHLGYSAVPIFAQFYAESVENIHAFIHGKPQKIIS
jgi:phosphoglycerate dehydrogenase-like enzyme